MTAGIQREITIRSSLAAVGMQSVGPLIRPELRTTISLSLWHCLVE